MATGNPDIDGKWDFTVERREVTPKPWRGERPYLNSSTHARVVDCTWEFELAPVVKPTQQELLQPDPA